MSDFVEQVVDHLKIRCASVLAQVVAAIDADEVLKSMALTTDASAIVVPLSEAGGPVDGGALQISQLETLQFGVQLVLKFPGGFPQFVPARDGVKAALRGWRPVGLSSPVAYLGGATTLYSASAQGGRWLYLLRFGATSKVTYGAQS